jgi:hypothetical protein
MGKVEVDIYMNQLISFFENNPNDLMDLIGNENKTDFYKRVKEQCFINLNKGDDVSLTKQQLIDIVVDMKGKTNPKSDILTIQGKVLKTKFGDIFLN